MNSNKSYFENIYRKTEFKFHADSRLMREMLTLKKSGHVLDLGCGEGGNAIYLAKKGFKVTCVDISPTAIKRIKEKSKKLKLKITAKISDLESFTIKRKYDLILSTGVFHLLSYKKGVALIKNIKEMTKKGGVNIIISFTKGDLTYRKRKLYFKNGQLKELYSDWNIFKYNEFDEKDDHMIHLVAKIIAIKRPLQ